MFKTIILAATLALSASVASAETFHNADGNAKIEVNGNAFSYSREVNITTNRDINGYAVVRCDFIFDGVKVAQGAQGVGAGHFKAGQAIDIPVRAMTYGKKIKVDNAYCRVDTDF